MATNVGVHIGTVVGNTSSSEYKFVLRALSAKLGDLVTVSMTVPTGKHEHTQKVIVWGRIVSLARFNPFLPVEAGQELADHGVELLDTVLSHSRDQIEATVLVLGCAPEGNVRDLRPLNYPVSPGAEVTLPPGEAVKAVLTGDENVHRLRIGTLIGRPDIDVRIKTNAIVARHIAVLAMTGGGKTVAARRLIRELLGAGYPLVIFDPHGDYLGLWSARDRLPGSKIRLFFPSLSVREETRDLLGYLVAQMTQGFTEPQKDAYQEALEGAPIDDEGTPVRRFVDRLLQKLDSMKDTNTRGGGRRHPGTIPAVMRGLRIVRSYLDAMEASNERLRTTSGLGDLPFEAMPDPRTSPHEFVQPGQACILYLGGYDHLSQSTIVALVLKQLFEERSSMSNTIPPLLAIIEEAHNFIPSRGEGQADTPSVEVIRKVITEGRKFGVGLALISQRPSRLDETTLSQCNTFLIFRLVNPRDQNFVERVMENLSKADSRLLPGFGPGQGIVSGQAVRFPLVVQVDFDEDLVTKTLGDEDFLAAVGRWKESQEAESVRTSQRLEEELDDLT